MLVQLPKRIGDHEMVAPALRRTQRVVGNVADLAVREVVCVHALLAYEPSPPELIESAHELDVADGGRATERLRGELAADRGRESDQLVCRRREAAKSRADDGMQFGRERG